MKIDNEFRVSAPVDTAWELLTDIPTIAPCMPGAQLTGSNGDEHEGKVKIKVGPITSEYKGKATFIEKDDVAHKAVIKAEGRDSRGAGNASANITATMKADGDATLVSIDTDLKITGKVAQFGRGVIVDVSEKLLGQFVDCLEQKLMTTEQDAGKIAGASADVSDGAGSAAGAAASAVGTAQAAAGKVGNVADAAASGVGGAAGGVTGAAASATGKVGDAVGDAAGGVTGKIGGAAGGVTGKIGDAAGGVTGAAGGVAGKLGDVAGGAAGGVTGAAAGGIGKAAAVGAAGAAAVGGAAAMAKGAAGSAGDEVEALDLGELAGGAVFKRFIPVLIAAVIIIALLIWWLA